MDKKLGIIIGVVLVLVAVIAAVFMLKGNKEKPNVDNSKPNMTTDEIISAFYLN